MQQAVARLGFPCLKVFFGEMTPLTEVYDSHSDTLQTWTEMPMTMHNIQYHF